MQWEHDPRTQQLMRDRGVSTERGLQLWFMARIGEHLTSLHRRMVGWDEILEGETPPSAVIASWRGTTGITAAARRGHDVIACPDDQVYLDYRQSERADEPIPVGSPLTVRRAYHFDSVPPGANAQEAAHVLGGQANVWTERMDSARDLDFYVFPRRCAIAVPYPARTRGRPAPACRAGRSRLPNGGRRRTHSSRRSNPDRRRSTPIQSGLCRRGGTGR